LVVDLEAVHFKWMLRVDLIFTYLIGCATALFVSIATFEQCKKVCLRLLIKLAMIG